MNAERGEVRYQRVAGIVARRLAGETLLVRIGGQTTRAETRAADLLVLNASGELLWECLAKPSTVADLARKLISEFEVSASAAEADALAFVNALRDVDAVVESPGA